MTIPKTSSATLRRLTDFRVALNRCVPTLRVVQKIPTSANVVYPHIIFTLCVIMVNIATFLRLLRRPVTVMESVRNVLQLLAEHARNALMPLRVQK